MTAPNAPIALTSAHVLRHTPPGARTQGREAALVDIAQDLLLRELHTIGLMGELAFKGGTALRKLYAGNAGRFSLDLDFAIRNIGTQAEEILQLLEEHVSGLRLGPFEYGIKQHRGKRHLLIRSDVLGTPENLMSKLDVSPPPWLEPITRGWIPMPVHDCQGPVGTADTGDNTPQIMRSTGELSHTGEGGLQPHFRAGKKVTASWCSHPPRCSGRQSGLRCEPKHAAVLACGRVRRGQSSVPTTRRQT